MPVTLIAIFFLLFTAFDSGKMATLILLNVPFAAVGGLLVLPLAGLTLSVSALVGFISLFGVSVQNGVLLVERIHELRRTGMAMTEAVMRAATETRARDEQPRGPGTYQRAVQTRCSGRVVARHTSGTLTPPVHSP